MWKTLSLFWTLNKRIDHIMSALDDLNALLGTEAADETALATAITAAVGFIQSDAANLTSIQAQLAALPASIGSGHGAF